MADRLRLGLIFGGRSVEHEVSVVSAQHVIAAADPSRFEVVPIGVTKDGVWLTPNETASQLKQPDAPFKKTLYWRQGGAVVVDRIIRTRKMQPLVGDEPGDRDSQFLTQTLRKWREPDVKSLQAAVGAFKDIDVIFPLIHGQHGEDGTLQGLLELLDIPYVGCGVAASAVGMDKALMKSVFLANGLPIGDYVVLDSARDEASVLASARRVEERIGYPAFVKPANGGSSVGISKASDREGLAVALVEAARHDRRIVVEQAVSGREIECAVLGNQDAEASPVGEIRYRREFYDFEAKYLDPTTEIIAPADLPAEVVERVQSLALRAFHAIDGAGMSRVDFFLLQDGSLRVLEINTIPGFTPGSMFPRLWQTAGVDYSSLITRLVELALMRHS